MNLINSVQSFSDFIDGISGAELGATVEDGTQTIPFYHSMRFEDFDILINKGFVNNTKRFDQYIRYEYIRAEYAATANLEMDKNKSLRTKKSYWIGGSKHNGLRSRRMLTKEEIITVDDILKDTSFTQRLHNIIFIKRDV